MGARFKPLDELPLFAGEADLAVALLGTGNSTAWRGIVPILEKRGFPTIDGLMGGRYVPAVKAFFDREYRVSGPEQVRAPHERAALGAYGGKRKSAAAGT